MIRTAPPSPGYVEARNVHLWVKGEQMEPASDWVLLVAGGLLQVPAARAIKALGYQLAVSDRDLDCACAGLADHFVELDTFDVAGHIDFVQSWPYGFRAVFTAAADPIVTVAKAARAAGCHGTPVRVAEICADKRRTRMRLYTESVPQPDFEYCPVGDILGYERFEVAGSRIASASFIVKATGSSGSRGHTRGMPEDFQSPDWRREAFNRASRYSKDAILIEELLTGVELSVETLWYDGTMIPLNAVERPFLPGTTVELGHYNPFITDSETYTKIWAIMEQAGRAVGLDSAQGGHILKGDLILTDEGPKVLELTTRLSGGFDSGWTSPLSRGVDYTMGVLLLALGEGLDVAMPYFVPRWHRHAAAWAVLGPEAGGVIKEIKVPDWVRECGEVVVRFQPGDVLPPLTDCTARAAFCIASSGTPQMAYKMAEAMAAAVEVVVE
jgi:biotin carboxylase